MVTIGITSYTDEISWGAWQRHAAFVPSTYLSFVEAAGHSSRILAPGVALSPEESLAGCAALILAGGPDVNPARYGVEAHALTGTPQDERDAWEFGLLTAAIATSTAVLGVCRGMQLINVYFGGTLVQHLPDLVDHDDHLVVPGHFGRHDVFLDPDSPMAEALGDVVSVPTYHHQGIDRLGDGVQPAGFATDGMIEAIVLPGVPHVWGVQWHPEEDCETALLTALIASSDSKVLA